MSNEEAGLSIPVPAPPPADLYTYHVSDPNRIGPVPMSLFDRYDNAPDLFVTLCTHHARIWREHGIVAAWTATPARRPKCILCPALPEADAVERGEWKRASGLTTCHLCGCPFFEHGEVRGYEWLRRICDGRLVKL